MKLSNKILIGFFGFAFLYMIAAFTEIRFKGDPNRIDDDNGIIETVGIAGVNYLVLPDVKSQMSIIGSNDPKIEVKSIKGDLLKYLKYEISGDTLIMKGFDLPEDQRARVTFYVPKNGFVGLTSDHGGVSIGELDQATLSITQIDGWIRIGDKNKLGNLILNARSGAYFTVSESDLDTLSVTADDSQVSIMTRINLAEGVISNDSYINLNNVGEVRFKKDESSRLILN